MVTNAHTDRSAELSRLCCSCGCCCDGSLAFWATLEPDQVAAAKHCGLDVREASTEVGFRIPCPQLVNLRCAVYDHPGRPRVCRTYLCWLAQRFVDGSVTAEGVAIIIREVNELKSAAAKRIGARLAASWARGAKRCYARPGTEQDALPNAKRQQFGGWLANVLGATDEDGVLNAQLLETLLAAGCLLNREFVWPADARERMLHRDREAAAPSTET